VGMISSCLFLLLGSRDDGINISYQVQIAG
jgi:hypothetical protein